MAGAEALAGIAVEVFVKQDQVAPVGVGGEALGGAEARAAAVGGGDEQARQTAGQVPAVLQKPFHALAKTGQRLKLLVIEDLDGRQRNEPDHRADAQGNILTVRVQPVVVEAVGLVPQSAAAQRVHGVGNGNEVF